MPSTRIIRTFGAQTIPGHRPSTRELAPYNDSIEDILPKNLNENLQDVLAYIFPLSADLVRMQNFLDRYLNFPNGDSLEDAPPVYFKPAAPFVLLEVANYGRLSSNIVNAGWFSQREIAFGMAVEWYARNGKDIRFLKYALIYPYVYVDSPLGIAGGREIYGWSKAPIEVAQMRKDGRGAVPVPLAPVFEPPTEQLLLAAQLVIPGKSPESAALKPKLIEIRQARYLQTASSAVPDMLTAVPRAIGASLNTGWEALNFFLRSGSSAARQFGSLSKLLPQYREIIAKYLPSWITQTSGYRVEDAQPPGTASSIITFKQVRDIEDRQAQDPGRACYQGILESQMQIKRLSDGGSLVDATNPDPSAGMYIDLFEYRDGIPGPLELGMEYKVLEDEQRKSGGDRAPGKVFRRYRVVPFLPFWVNMDLQYGLADYQAWRTTWTDWTDTNTPKIRTNRLNLRYVELGAGASEEIAPPAEFEHVTMRILPLAARTDNIRKILSDYLNNTHQHHPPRSYFDFEPILLTQGRPANRDAVVLAILSNFEGMKTVLRHDATYDDYEFTFAIPVIWTDNTNHRRGIGLVPVYNFAHSAWNAITTGEVYGRWTLQSKFISAPFPYTLPPRKQVTPGLRIKTQLFPKGKPSEEVDDLTIVELATSYSGLFQSETRRVTQQLIEPLVKKLLKDLRLPEKRAREYPFYGIALKQVRDANDPQKADYQASVWLERTFTLDDTAAWLNSDIELHIPNYETVSIVDRLGLKSSGYEQLPDSWPHSKGVYTVKPVGRSRNQSSCIVVSGKLTATSADIGWWRIGIGKDSWKRSEFAPKWP